MRYIEFRLRVPVLVDLRVLAWLWSSFMVAWHEWHMARLDHMMPADEYCECIHKADMWRRRAAWRPRQDRPRRGTT